MSEKKKDIFKDNPTVREFFKSILDDKETYIFRMVYDGQSWAGNPKRKTNTRVSIIIPKDIAENNLKFMRDWNFYIIGVKAEKKEACTETDRIKRNA